MSKVQAVIFDLYGTLIDVYTDENKKEVWDYLSLYLQYYGANCGSSRLKLSYEAEKEKHIHSRSERFPEVDLEVVFDSVLEKEGLKNGNLAESCCKLFRLLSRERFELFPDALPVLREMKRRYPLAIISNAQRVFCHEEIRLHFLDQFFSYILLSTDFGFIKPDPRLFSVACALLGVAPESAVYIGDNPENDVSGAKMVGMRVVLLNRGGKNIVADRTPDFIAGNLREAGEWVHAQ